MDVATIIANIKSQALIGNTGAADDEARILRYLNKAYHRVCAGSFKVNPSFFEKYQTVAITDGAGLFPYPVHKIQSVVDTGNNQSKLRQRSFDSIREADPALVQQGNPHSYDRVLNGLVTYPRNSTTLGIWYVPMPPDLTANTQEIDILVPPDFHEVLEWATLWTIAYDERDKISASELAVTKNTYDGLMEDLKLYLFNQLPNEKRRVRGW